MSPDPAGRIRLDLFNVYGDQLNERLDLFFHHQVFSETKAIRGLSASRPFVVKGLRAAPEGLYRLYVDPPSYLPVSVFVNISASGTAERSLPFAFDREKIIRVDFPGWDEITHAQGLLERSRDVLGFRGLNGNALYSGIDDIRKAGFLNIIAKTRRTPLAGGGLVVDSILELKELRGDRFFATVTHQLREQVKNSILEGLFREVSGALHRPPDGFSPAGSYKTLDTYGNLQLTFFASGDNWMADIDIDDASGLGHLFQVARNALTGLPTHPYDIHQILLRHQEIDSGFRLIVAETAGRRRRTRAAGQKG